MMVSAILLAAGESKRMGTLKQLLPLGDSTMIERAIDTLLASKVDEVIVVLGYKAEEIKEKIGGRTVKTVINQKYSSGMSASIKQGLQEVDKKAEAVMLCLADLPLIDSKTINSLIEAYYNTDKGIVVPVYQRKRGHPVIFSMSYKEELTNLEGDTGGRQILENHSDDIIELPVDSSHITDDIDTVIDYQSFKDIL